MSSSKVNWLIYSFVQQTHTCVSVLQLLQRSYCCLSCSETYSFVLTNETGQRQYGHCRRIVVS